MFPSRIHPFFLPSLVSACFSALAHRSLAVPCWPGPSCPHQLDAIRKRLNELFPNIEAELASFEQSPLPGTPSRGCLGAEASWLGADDKLRSEHNPAGRGAGSSPVSPRRKLMPLPPVHEGSAGRLPGNCEAMNMGWSLAQSGGGSEKLNAVVQRIVREEIEGVMATAWANESLGRHLVADEGSASQQDEQEPDHEKAPADTSGHGGTHGANVCDTISVTESTDEGEEYSWVYCAENAYGALIFMGTTASLSDALVRCGPMVAVSVLIQAVFSLELAFSLNSLADPLQGRLTCGIPADLQFAAIMVYLCLMLNNVGSMMSAANVALFSPAFKIEEEEGAEETKQELTKPISTHMFVRILIFLIAVVPLTSAGILPCVRCTNFICVHSHESTYACIGCDGNLHLEQHFVCRNLLDHHRTECGSRDPQHGVHNVRAERGRNHL